MSRSYRYKHCCVTKCSWTSKDHQGAISNAIALEPLDYKLRLGLSSNTSLEQQDGKSKQPQTLNRIRFYRKWEQVRECQVWQASNRMTIVSQQVGALKQDHEQSQMVWKYIWNNQTNLDWLLPGSSLGVTLGHGPGTSHGVLYGTCLQLRFCCS